MADRDPRQDPKRKGLSKTEHSVFSDFSHRVLIAIGLAVLIVALLLLVWQTVNILLIIFAGILVAVFLRGLTNYVADHTPLSHSWSLIAVLFGLLTVLGVSGWLLAPSISEQATKIAEKVPEAIDQLEQWAKGTSMGGRLLADLPGPLGLLERTGLGWDRISGMFSNVFGILTNVVFILFFGLYLAIDPGLYKRGLVRLTPMSYRDRFERVLDVLSHQLGWWLVGRFLSMLAVAVMTTVGLWALGIPLPLVIGLLSGLLSFVPIIGPIVSFVPAGLLALLVGPSYVLYTLLLYFGVQAIEGYFITPVIQHRTVSLPPALILASQLVAGMLFGLIGVIIATPITVLLLALTNLLYVEDVLGDETTYSDKVSGDEESGDEPRSDEQQSFPNLPLEQLG